MSYKFLPPGFLPALEAASLLAFGDTNFVEHLTENRIDKERGEIRSPKAACPEIDRAARFLMQQAETGKVKIIALRRTVQGWDRAESPPINERYEPIPASYFKFNDWTFGWPENFPIYKPFDPVTKSGGAYRAEWFYPAVNRTLVERLRSTSASRRGSEGAVAATVDDYVQSIKAAGDHPNIDAAWDYVRQHLPSAGRERVREVYREKTGRSAVDRGRPKIAEK